MRKKGFDKCVFFIILLFFINYYRLFEVVGVNSDNKKFVIGKNIEEINCIMYNVIMRLDDIDNR